MKSKFLYIAVVAYALLLTACKPESKPIEYGSEACAYCRMSIVDERYGTQLVSSTGKMHSFDAIECMLHFKLENPKEEWAMELVTDYTQPGKLIPAQEVYIFRSKALPSPMGMFLTAIKEEETVQALRKEKGGKIYDYATVAREIDELPSMEMENLTSEHHHTH